MEIQHRLIKFVTHCNWILLVCAVVASFSMFSQDVAWGVLIGGLIVAVNFHLLYRTLKNAFLTSQLMSITGVLVKYYIRFAVSGIIIFILMAKQYVNPIGLLIGLSIVVVSIICATLFELTKTNLKEAL